MEGKGYAGSGGSEISGHARVTRAQKVVYKGARRLISSQSSVGQGASSVSEERQAARYFIGSGRDIRKAGSRPRPQESVLGLLLGLNFE